MLFHNDKIDFRRIIEEIKRNEIEKWEKVKNYCKKYKKNQVELIREAIERIKRYNKKKYDKINDPRTLDWERTALIIEDILSTFPEVKRRK